MAFTNFGYFNDTTPGAPALQSVNGSLNAFLHYALTTVSNWTRLFHDAVNFRDVWQPASGGSTPVVICKHNSADSGDARLAVMRMAEGASSTTSFTNPFPTTTQSADTTSNWMISNTASTTRAYHCCVWETGLVLAVQLSGTTDVWDIFFFGKMFSRYSNTDDPYPWAIDIRNTSSVATINTFAALSTSVTITVATTRLFAQRHPQGTILSSQLGMFGTGSTLSIVSGTPAAGAGYLGTIDRQKVLMHDISSNTTAVGPLPIYQRFCVPQIYSGVHSTYAGIGQADIITDGSHAFVLLKQSGSAMGILLETTNLFSGYPAG